MESGKNLRCVKIGVGPTLGLGQNWHLPKIVVLLTLAFSQNFLLNYLMPNFYQYSKFTSKHIISVKVDFAIDLACFFLHQPPWENKKQAFLELFREIRTNLAKK